MIIENSELAKALNVGTVVTIGNAYRGIEDEIEEAKKYLLNEFCEKEQFTKEQYDAYRAGLGGLIKLFEACSLLVEMESQKESTP